MLQYHGLLGQHPINIHTHTATINVVGLNRHIVHCGDRGISIWDFCAHSRISMDGFVLLGGPY